MFFVFLCSPIYSTSDVYGCLRLELLSHFYRPEMTYTAEDVILIVYSNLSSYSFLDSVIILINFHQIFFTQKTDKSIV